MGDRPQAGRVPVVLSREPDVEKLERSVALQNEYGLDSRMLTAVEARELCPLVHGDDILAGAYSPGDGHATPEGVVQGYALVALRLLGLELGELVARRLPSSRVPGLCPGICLLLGVYQTPKQTESAAEIMAVTDRMASLVRIPELR
ncbi:MAG: FAD-dependent oxidoreductase [Solirubrobacterales bacterium]